MRHLSEEQVRAPSPTRDEVRVVPLDNATARLLTAANPTWAAAVPVWQESMHTGRSTLLVALHDDAPVGVAQLVHRMPPEICNVGVPEEQRGQGIGTALMREAERRAQPAGRLQLGVGVDNSRARRLYERLGYRLLGEQVTTTYEYVDAGGVRYSATETDEMMEKDLTEP